jgi:hypothetical protein
MSRSVSKNRRSKSKRSGGGEFRLPRSNPDPLLPIRMRRTMRYSTQVQLDPTTSVSVYQFRLNSLHDPDFTGTGHQPMGYDQFSALYQQWWVIGSRVTVDAVLLTSAVSIASVAVVRSQVGFFATANDTTVPTTADQMIENHNCRFRHLTGYRNQVRFSQSFYHPTLFGMTESQYLADDEFGGGIGSNPVRWAVGDLAAITGFSGADTQEGVVECQLLFEFDVVFKAPIVLATS